MKRKFVGTEARRTSGISRFFVVEAKATHKVHTTVCQLRVTFVV
jgi:hypothetical protein